MSTKRKITRKKSSRRTKSRITDGKRKFSQITPMRTLKLNAVSAVPDSIMVKMKYVSQIKVDTTAAFFYDQIYRGNSLFDPDYTNAGHQPLGFDQWSAFYNKYRVLACAAKLNIINEAAGPPVHVVFGPSTSTTTYAGDLQEAAEQPRAKYIGPLEVASRRTHSCKHYMSTSEVLGVPLEAVRDENDYAAANSTNPNKIWYWHLSLVSTDVSSDLLVTWNLELVYYCVLFDRIALTNS